MSKNKEGQLVKVEIRGYTNKTFSSESGKFTLPINPENYSRNFKVKEDSSQAGGSQGNDNKVTGIEPEQLKLDFYFDNTGTVEGNHLDGTKISGQINEFLSLVYEFKDKIHQPRYLRICWGALVFDCRLTDLTIDFLLFNSSGEPLRAKLSATFTEYIEQYKRVLLEDKQSPDLTHIRKVRENEKLDLITHEQYGSNEFFLQVAKVNNLTSPRLIQTGQDLLFPPIEN